MSFKKYLLNEQYEYHKQEGERLHSEGRLGEARIELERALEMLRNLKSDEELGLENQLQSISMTLTEQNLSKARSYWEDGDLEAALSCFQSALGIVRSSAVKDDILVEVSRLKLELEPVQEIEELEKEARENPDELSTIFALAMEYALSGYFERSIFELKKILEKDPQHEECLLRIGNACSDSSRFLEAEEYYRRGLALDGEFKGRFHYRLGEIAQSSGRYAEAEDLFQSSLSANSDDIDSLMAMARLYKRTGKWESAIDYFERVLSIDPDDGETLLEIAAMWEERHMIKNAREIWVEILEKETNEDSRQAAKEKLSFYQEHL